MTSPPPKVAQMTIQAILDERGVQYEDPNSYTDIYRRFNLFMTNILQLANNLSKHSHEKMVRVDHMNQALIYRNFKPVFGYRKRKAIKYEVACEANGERIEVPIDRQIELSDIVRTTMKPYPIEEHFSFHWLAVLKGIQPRICENVKYVLAALLFLRGCIVF